MRGCNAIELDFTDESRLSINACDQIASESTDAVDPDHEDGTAVRNKMNDVEKNEKVWSKISV